MCDVTMRCNSGFVSLSGISADTARSISVEVLGLSRGTMVMSICMHVCDEHMYAEEAHIIVGHMLDEWH